MAREQSNNRQKNIFRLVQEKRAIQHDKLKARSWPPRKGKK